MLNGFKEKYVNPFTDFGFKKLFGEEPNKDLLIDFLNELLKDKHGEIKDLTYMKTERLGFTEGDRKAIFDLYCESEKGEKFIVELQKFKHKFFKDRSLFYSAFPIINQAEKGIWDYGLKPVYTIAILDFVFDEHKDDPERYRYDVKLTDIFTKEIFYDKLTFIYLEMPKFNKELDELDSRFDKWLYVLKNLPRLHDLPDKLRERVFEKLFEAAEIARFTPEQTAQYQYSLKVTRDWHSVISTWESAAEESEEKGRQKGLEEGRKKGLDEGKKQEKEGIALNMLNEELPISLIIKVTGLSAEEIAKLKK